MVVFSIPTTAMLKGGFLITKLFETHTAAMQLFSVGDVVKGARS
jgi:hypothetical protein